jgi:hypothetical protein
MEMRAGLLAAIMAFVGYAKIRLPPGDMDEMLPNGTMERAQAFRRKEYLFLFSGTILRYLMFTKFETSTSQMQQSRSPFSPPFSPTSSARGRASFARGRGMSPSANYPFASSPRNAGYPPAFASPPVSPDASMLKPQQTNVPGAEPEESKLLISYDPTTASSKPKLSVKYSTTGGKTVTTGGMASATSTSTSGGVLSVAPIAFQTRNSTSVDVPRVYTPKGAKGEFVYSVPGNAAELGVIML